MEQQLLPSIIQDDTIYDTSIEEDTIFTTTATIAPSPLYNRCPEGTTKYMICPNCDTMYQIQLGCNQKTCPICLQRRKTKLFNKYFPLIRDSWIQPADMTDRKAPRIQFLTLTFRNVMQLTPQYLKACNAQLEAFRRRLARIPINIQQGFICKEMTVSEDMGYHYHFHVLFYGEFIDLTKFDTDLQRIWSNIVGYSAHIKLYSKFIDAEHSLYYILKYNLKSRVSQSQMVPRIMFDIEGHPIQVPHLSIYLEMSKKAMNFRAFGKSFKPAKKLPMICPQCMCPFQKDPVSYKRRNPLYSYIPIEKKLSESYLIDWNIIHRNIIKYDEINRQKPLGLEEIEQMLDSWMPSRDAHDMVPVVHHSASGGLYERVKGSAELIEDHLKNPRERRHRRHHPEPEEKAWQLNSRTQDRRARASAT